MTTPLPFPLTRTREVADLRAERDGLLAANLRVWEFLRTVDPSGMTGQQVVDDLLRELAATET